MRFDPLWLTNKIKKDAPDFSAYPKNGTLKEKQSFLKDRRMIEEILYEKFLSIGVYQGVEVFDTRHAEEEFTKFFPNEDGITFRFLLSQGMKSIMQDFDYQQGQYVIVSKSLGARIPLEIRFDAQLLKRGIEKIIGIVPTVRGPKEIYDKYRAIQVLVENNVDYGFVNMIPEEYGDFGVHIVGNDIVAEFVDIVV